MFNNLNNLEKIVLTNYLNTKKITSDFFGKDFNLIKVVNREFSSKGFFTDILSEKNMSEYGIIKDRGGGNITAVLNKDITVGFVIFVDNGKLHMIEGFTFDRLWPNDIGSFKIIQH